jgi:hypothetical protein
MEKSKKPVRVTRTSDQRSPQGVRRLGRALIALAQAQLEAEAQAQAEAKASARPRQRDVTRPPDNTHHRNGDAA